MVDKTVEKVVTEIASQYSFLVGRRDDFALGKKTALVSLADLLGFNVIVNNRSVILRASDGSFQVCA